MEHENKICAGQGPCPPACPVCGSLSQPTHVRTMPQAFIEGAIRGYYQERPPDLGLVDYDLWRCNECSLEFSCPLLPGTNRFYDYVTSQNAYYPVNRWEWDVTIDRMARDRGTGTVLEIGCGIGLFLERLRQKTNLHALGLDLTQGAVDVCRQKSLEVYAGRIEDWRLVGGRESDVVDFAVAFHCLEHVEDPLGFVRAMVQATKADGRIYLSTPHSPMSYESIWFDPLNHPPHHMTRWNVKAFRRLAEMLGLRATFHMPPAPLIWRSVLRAVAMAQAGRAGKSWRVRRQAANALLHPIELAKVTLHQVLRDRTNGRTAADVVLVELSRAHMVQKQAALGNDRQSSDPPVQTSLHKDG